jgi:REP element-mobilizing transposase RayT
MTYYERNLPHWQPEGRAIFLTWRLAGSLPQAFLDHIRSMRKTPRNQFLEADRRLDRASSGPLWLRRAEIAETVVRTSRKGEEELRQYTLRALVVMANHVHVLMEPHLPLSRITNGIKGVSARDANRVLGRTGRPFWQDESFDHWVRSAAGMDRIIHYIEWNPVKAGLAAKPDEWPWSSAHK